MLPKESRLPKQALSILFKTGKRTGTKEFLLIFNQTKLPSSRFCIIVRGNKKTTAVERNRTKRLLRETIRKNVKLCADSVDGIFVVRPISKNILYSEIDMLIQKIFTL